MRPEPLRRADLRAALSLQLNRPTRRPARHQNRHPVQPPHLGRHGDGDDGFGDNEFRADTHGGDGAHGQYGPEAHGAGVQGDGDESV